MERINEIKTILGDFLSQASDLDLSEKKQRLISNVNKIMSMDPLRTLRANAIEAISNLEIKPQMDDVLSKLQIIRLKLASLSSYMQLDHLNYQLKRFRKNAKKMLKANPKSLSVTEAFNALKQYLTEALT